MTNIESMARERTETTRQPYMQWLEALSEGKSLQEEAHLDDSQFQRLCQACETPVQLALIIEALDALAKEHPESQGFRMLICHVDASSYDLGAWVGSLEVVYQWLGQAGRVSPGLEPILEYISCCTEAASAVPAGYPLSGVVEDMLEQYGMETA